MVSVLTKSIPRVLFGVPGLSAPADCERLARAAVEQGGRIARSVVAAHSLGGPAAPRAIVRGIDALSSTAFGQR